MPENDAAASRQLTEANDRAEQANRQLSKIRLAVRKAGKRLCEADESECTEAGWSAIGSRLGGTDKAHRLLHGGAHNAAIPSKDDPDSDDKRTRESIKEALAQPTALRDIQRTLASAETTRLYSLAGMCTTALQRASCDVEEATVAAGETATALQNAQSEVTRAFFHGLTPLSGAPPAEPRSSGTMT